MNYLNLPTTKRTTLKNILKRCGVKYELKNIKINLQDGTSRYVETADINESHIDECIEKIKASGHKRKNGTCKLIQNKETIKILKDIKMNSDTKQKKETSKEDNNSLNTDNNINAHYKKQSVDTIARCKANMKLQSQKDICIFSIDKYLHREKGQNLSDIKKIRDYLDWLEEIEKRIEK